MNLTISQPSTIDDQLARVSDRLRRCDDAQVAKLVASMMAAGLAVPPGIDPNKLNIVYSIAVKGASHTGLTSAVRKFIRGEYPGQSYSFMPTPPELGHRARSEDEDDWQHMQRLRDRRDSIRAGAKPEPKDPESIERIRKLVSGVKAKLKKFDETIVGFPATAEQQEQIRKMLALPDRGDVTFEEREYRSKMAAKLED